MFVENGQLACGRPNDYPMKNTLTFFILLCAVSFTGNGAIFSLTDTDPDSPEFRARFLGSFGINSAIEPRLDRADRPLYESIEPYLQKDPEKAIQRALKGIDSDSNAAFDFLVGSLYYSLENYVEAERYLQQAIEKFPDFRRAHRNLSLIYVRQLDFSKAIPHLLTVIKLGGGDGQSYSMLGYSYLNQEKYVSALSAYRMARMFLPDSADVRRGEAQCLLVTNQLDTAIALFDELIEEFPQEPDYWLLQANAYLAKQQFVEAITNLEIVHSMKPGTWETHKLLADLYIGQGMVTHALLNYESALAANPDIPADNALDPLRQLIERSLYQEAASYLQTLNAKLQSPLSRQLEIEKEILSAKLEIQIGDAQKGLQQLEALLEVDPLNGEALLAIADYKAGKSIFPEAEYYYERALSVDKFAVDALIGLARITVKQGRFKQALQYLTKAQKLNPRDDIKQYMARIENVISMED